MLHIADSIETIGPVWTSWAFPIERYCGALQPAIRSRRFPYSSLSRYILDSARLTHIHNLYDLKNELNFTPEHRISGTRIIGCKFLLLCLEHHANHLSDDTCTLFPPHRTQVTLSRALQDKIIGTLVTRFHPLTARDIRKIIPETVDEWGVLQIFEDGDRISSAELTRAGGDDRRDATYVRVSQQDFCKHFLN